MVGRCKLAWQKSQHVRSHVVMWHEVNDANEVALEDGTKEVRVAQIHQPHHRPYHHVVTNSMLVKLSFVVVSFLNPCIAIYCLAASKRCRKKSGGNREAYCE